MAGPFPDFAPPTPIASPLSLAQAGDQYKRMQALTPLDIGTAQLNYDKARQLAPIDVQKAQTELGESQLRLDTANKLAPYTIKAAGQKSDTETQDYQNGLLAEAARAAQAADPNDPKAQADIWDQKMQEAADKGVKNAKQYIGNYTSKLAENVADTYGPRTQAGQRRGADGTNKPAAGFDTDQYSRAIATAPAPAVQKSLETYNKIISAFGRAQTPEQLRDEITELKTAGVQIPPSLAGLDFNRTDKFSYATNHAAVDKFLNEQVIPRRDILAARAADLEAAQSGLPAPQPKPLYEPKYVLSGTQQGTGKGVYVEQTSGEEKVGGSSLGPKPSAQTSLFMYKQQAWLTTHPGDAQGALDYAQGKRTLSPQEVQKYAITQASRELYDTTLSDPGFQPEGGPEAWINKKAAEIAAQITQAGPPGAAAPGPARAPMSQADMTASINAARTALQKHPDQRATILNRLKAAGIPINGL